MSVRDFLLICLICLFWGLNVVLTRWVLTDGGLDAVFYAGLRFALIALLLLPFLWPVPRQLGLVFVISMCMGGAHFAVLFLGLANAEASAAAIVSQLGVPFSTLLSMLILSERVGWRRGTGMALAFLGVMVVMVEPSGFVFSAGLLYIAVAAFIGSLGGVLLKKVDPMPALRMQAWISLLSVAPLFAVSALIEPGASGKLAGAPWEVWAITAFAVVCVSIFGHSTFYWLLKRHDVTLLSPLTLMTPLWTVGLGAAILGEEIGWRLIVGGLVSLVGVGVIAARPNLRLPWAGMGRKLID